MANKPNIHKSEPGYISSKFNELTNNFCVLYDSRLSNFDSVTDKWAVFCVEHANVCSLKTKSIGKEWIEHPEEWCSECKILKNIKDAEEELSTRQTRPNHEQLKLWANLARGNSEKIALFIDIYKENPEKYWNEIS